MDCRFKLFIVCLSVLICASCAATTSRTRLGPDIFRVGEIEVWLYQNRHDLVNDLPASVSWLEAVRMGSLQMKICGYFDKEKNRIYAIDDARTVIHEFKHFLEPDWQHDEQTLPCKPMGANR